MYSVETVISAFAVLSFSVVAILFIFFRKSEGLTGYKIAISIFVPAVFMGIYFIGANHVYILNKGHESYEHKVLLLPTSYTFDDNETIKVKPRLGNYTVIINNSKREAIFKMAAYGEINRPYYDTLLPMNDVVYVNESADYVFKNPPALSKAEALNTIKGYISYYDRPVR